MTASAGYTFYWTGVSSGLGLSIGVSSFYMQEKKATRVEGGFAFANKVIAVARRFEATVLVNGDLEFARTAKADGVHMTAKQLMAMDIRPDITLCAASCHDESELLQAEKLGLDFVVLGPVLPTPSHPGGSTLDWDRFADLAKNYSLPIFALGGLNTDHQKIAWQRGGHGIAMLRNAWPA